MLKILSIFLISLMLAGCSQTKNTLKISFEGSSLQLEAQIANTSSSRAQGLMFVQSLPKNQAMLFIHQDQKPLSFWMANTLIPLDIIFLDESKTIVDIQKMSPCTKKNIKECPPYISKFPAKYAIELNQNLTDEYNIRVGKKAFWN